MFSVYNRKKKFYLLKFLFLLYFEAGSVPIHFGFSFQCVAIARKHMTIYLTQMGKKWASRVLSTELTLKGILLYITHWKLFNYKEFFFLAWIPIPGGLSLYTFHTCRNLSHFTSGKFSIFRSDVWNTFFSHYLLPSAQHLFSFFFFVSKSGFCVTRFIFQIWNKLAFNGNGLFYNLFKLTFCNTE